MTNPKRATNGGFTESSMGMSEAMEAMLEEKLKDETTKMHQNFMCA